MLRANSGLRQGFRIGPWAVEPLRGVVTAPDGETRHVEPKVMDVLVLLAGRNGEVLTRSEIVDAVWSRHTAADQQLTRAVSELRRVLDDDPAAPRFVETVPKRGYRLIAEVAPSSERDRSSRWSPKIVVAAAMLIVAAGLLAVFLRTTSPPDHGPDDNATPDAFAQTFDDGDPSIAVLPFDRLGADPTNAYLSEGLADEIRNLLASVPRLKVIGRRSSDVFAGDDADYSSIAQRLGVTRLLEGSVQIMEERVRISVQLIDASDGSVIWSDTFVEALKDVFTLQEDVAASVLGAMEIHIASSPQRGQPTLNAEAYALYLKAKQSLNLQDRLPAELALQEAVTLDPRFAEAWELLAFTYWVEARPERDAAVSKRLIRDAASSALEIDPQRPFARALYYEASEDGNTLPGAISAYISAARLQPNDASILRVLSWHLVMAGYLDQALAVSQRMVDIDPLSSMAHMRHVVSLNALGRTDDARAALELADKLDPADLAVYRGDLSLAAGDYEQAIKYFETEFANLGIEPTDWVRELVFAASRPETGAASLDSGIRAVMASVDHAADPTFEAGLERWYLLLGHLDRYMEIILETPARSPRWSDIEMHVYYGMMFRNLGFTAHPRYAEVAAHMGIVEVWEQLGAPDHCRKTLDRWHCR